MPTNVDADNQGFYDADTGEPIQIGFDQYGVPYNALTGQEVNLIGNAVSAAQNVLIGIFGKQGYPQSTSYPRGGVTSPRGAYPSQNAGGGAFVPGTVSTQGFQVNWWTAALLGLVVGAFVLGKKR